MAVDQEVEQVIYLSEIWWVSHLPLQYASQSILGHDTSPKWLSDAFFGKSIEKKFLYEGVNVL